MEKQSNCCGASAWFETDICSDCKEHADFETEVCEDYITCELCCYDIVDNNGDIMEHECINDL